MNIPEGMKNPAPRKLTGIAQKAWDTLIDEYSSVLKQRNLFPLVALCQQWELYQMSYNELKRRKVYDNERFKVSNQMSCYLKHFKDLSKDFAMGVNDELEFSVQPSIKKKQVKETVSRIGELLSGIGSNN